MPGHAILADVPEDQKAFIPLNASLAMNWKVADEIGALPDADVWKDKREKLALLAR